MRAVFGGRFSLSGSILSSSSAERPSAGESSAGWLNVVSLVVGDDAPRDGEPVDQVVGR